MIDPLQTAKMDKSTISVVSLFDPSDEHAYWLSRTPDERLAALELLRVINYGYDPASARLQRVLTVAQLGESLPNEPPN